MIDEPELERQERIEKAKIAKHAVLSLIRSKVWDGTLKQGKDVFMSGKNFGDDPNDAISACAFIKIVDEENKINGNFSIIRIPDPVREIVEKREKIKAAEKKSDGEIVLAYLKLEFMEDIKNGISKKQLLNKFIEKGEKDFDKKHEYYKYLVDGKKIRISRERLSYIASILLTPAVQGNKKSA